MTTSILFDDAEDKLYVFEIKDDENEMALLSKKLQRILRDKRNKEKRKTLPQRKNQNKND